MSEQKDTKNEENPSERQDATGTHEGKAEKEQQNSIETEQTPQEPISTVPLPAPAPPAQPSVTQAQVEQFTVGRLLLGDSTRQVAKLSGGTISKTTVAKFYPKEQVDALRQYILQRFGQGASDGQISQETQLIQSTIEQLRAKFGATVQVQTPSEQPIGQPIETFQQEKRSVPTGYLMVPMEFIDDLEKDAPPAFQRSVRRWRRDVVRHQQTILEQQQRRSERSNPDGSNLPAFVKTADDYLTWQMAESERRERPFRIRNLRDGKGKSTFSDVATAIKIGADLVRPQQQQQPHDRLADYRLGKMDEREGIKSNNPKGATSLLDLKLEEMRQSHDIDVETIRWEQKKFLLQAQADTDKWTKIQETFSPMIQMAAPEVRNAIRELGKGVGRSLGNPKSNVQVAETEKWNCPGCGADLNVNIPQNPPEGTNQVHIKCPKCGKITGVPIEKEGVPEERAELRPKSGRITSRYT